MTHAELSQAAQQRAKDARYDYDQIKVAFGLGICDLDQVQEAAAQVFKTEGDVIRIYLASAGVELPT